jgi:hypothetical protein
MLVLVYPMQMRAAEHGARSKNLAPLARDASRRLYAYVLAAPRPALSQDEADTGGASEAHSYRDTIHERQLVGEKGNLIAGLLIALMLAGILALEGATLLSEPARWGELLLYLVTVRYGLAALKRLVATMNQVNRQYLAVRTYYEFVSDVDSATAEGAPSPAERPQLTVRPLDGESGPLMLGAGGDVIALIHAGQIDRFTVMLFQDIERRAAAPGPPPKALTYWSAGRFDMVGRTVRQCFGFPSDYTEDHLRSDIVAVLGDERAADPWLPPLDQVLTKEDEALLRQRGSGAMRVMAAMCSDADVVLLSADDVAKSAESALRSAFATRILVVVYDDGIRRIGRLGEIAVLVSDGRRLLGWAPPQWARAHRLEIKRLAGIRSKPDAREEEHAPQEEKEEAGEDR